MGKIRFIIPGDPVGKGRPRFAATGKGKGKCYTPAKTRSYENKVALCCRAKNINMPVIPKSVPLRLEVEAVFAMPADLSAKKRDEMVGTPCLKKPDADNVLKAITDAMEGILFEQDSAIHDVGATKTWGVTGYAEVWLFWDDAEFLKALGRL